MRVSTQKIAEAATNLQGRVIDDSDGIYTGEVEAGAGAPDAPQKTPAKSDPPRKRGRPKGLGKVPGSGKKPGQKNWTNPEIRDVLLERSDAITVLADVCAGRELLVSGPTGRQFWARPTMTERLRIPYKRFSQVLPNQYHR